MSHLYILSVDVFLQPEKNHRNVLLYGSFCIGTWMLVDNVILQKTESVVQLYFFFIFYYLCVYMFLVCVYACLCVMFHVCYSVHVDVTGQLQMFSLLVCYSAAYDVLGGWQASGQFYWSHLTLGVLELQTLHIWLVYMVERSTLRALDLCDEPLHPRRQAISSPFSLSYIDFFLRTGNLYHCFSVILCLIPLISALCFLLLAWPCFDISWVGSLYSWWCFCYLLMADVSGWLLFFP